MGSNNSQVGLQYNHEEHHHYGLSVADATNMAFAMFREYYPQLRQEALESVEQLVKAKLGKCSVEQIVPPSPRIAVPTLQNASITEETDIREIYANLLVNSMNAEKKNSVHPSFVDIIRQLSSDEAKILCYLKTHHTIPTVSIRLPIGTSGYGRVLDDFTDVPELINCECTDSTVFQFNNLIRLGLVKKWHSDLFVSEKEKARLRAHPVVQMNYEKARESVSRIKQFTKVDERIEYYDLTEFGSVFCKVCIE